MTRYPCGTYASYSIDGCRCLPCTDANRDRARRASAERKQREPYRLFFNHGTYKVRHRETGEIALRTTSRVLADDERRRLNKLAAETAPQPLTASEHLVRWTRQHLRRLADHGIGVRTVAARAGLNRRAIDNVRRDGIRVRTSTCEAILGVRLTAVAGGALVDATETWRLVDELRAYGWPKSRIARLMGQTGQGLQLGRREVTVRNAKRMQAIHDDAWRRDAAFRQICGCRSGLAAEVAS